MFFFLLFDSYQGALKPGKLTKLKQLELFVICLLISTANSAIKPLKFGNIACAIQQVNHKWLTIFKCFLFNFKSDTRNNPNNTAIFVDTCSWFFFDKRALGIWCNGIVPYKPNEFLMHRAHTITVRTRLTRQHHKHFSYSCTIGWNPFWRCILNFAVLGFHETLMMRITYQYLCTQGRHGWQVPQGLGLAQILGFNKLL